MFGMHFTIQMVLHRRQNRRTFAAVNKKNEE